MRSGEIMRMAMVVMVMVALTYCGCYDTQPGPQPSEVVIEKTTPEGSERPSDAIRRQVHLSVASWIDDAGVALEKMLCGDTPLAGQAKATLDRNEVTCPTCLALMRHDEVGDLRATATAGLKALASMTPLEAAGVLTATGFGSTTWVWTPPNTGAPVDHYRVEFHFTVRDTFFRYWFPSWAECTGDTVIVRGVDAVERVGPNSVPGVCQ